MSETGNITIKTYPAGASIYVDSALVTDSSGNPISTPSTLNLEIGMHRFQLVLLGYYEDWAHIYIYPGSDIELNRPLMPSPLPYGTPKQFHGYGSMQY